MRERDTEALDRLDHRTRRPRKAPGRAVRCPPRTGCRWRRGPPRTIERMALASTSSDVVTAVCMAVVLGMGGLLVFRATRKRDEDVEDEDRGDRLA